jgi:hypothetical protein
MAGTVCIKAINRVNIATTRVRLFLLASSASPIVLVLVVVLVLDLFAAPPMKVKTQISLEPCANSQGRSENGVETFNAGSRRSASRSNRRRTSNKSEKGERRKPQTLRLEPSLTTSA